MVRGMVFGKARGQAAVEYLVILAVVIIIALVVVGVLGGFPQLTAGVDSRQSQTYWAQADVGITPPVLVNSTGGQLTVRNNKNFKITIRSVSGSAATLSNTTSFGGQLNSGQTKTVTASFGGCTAGSTYSSTITFTYADGSGNVYTFTGALPYTDTCQG